MIIRDFFYDTFYKILRVEFSTNEDGSDFFRVISLDEWELKYYSPIIITKRTLDNLHDDFIIDVLIEFFKTNELPEREVL
jgi:hypothetical protein